MTQNLFSGLLIRLLNSPAEVKLNWAPGRWSAMLKSLHLLIAEQQTRSDRTGPWSQRRRQASLKYQERPRCTKRFSACSRSPEPRLKGLLGNHADLVGVTLAEGCGETQENSFLSSE